MTSKSRRHRLGAFAGAAALAVPLLLASPSPALAETNPACPSGVTQIGITAHLKVGGATFASVKQFKGCGKNWGYLFVWKSWRDSHPGGNWDMCVLIAVGRSSPFQVATQRCEENTRLVEMWSLGTNTLTVCTHVLGYVPDGPSARTDIRC